MRILALIFALIAAPLCAAEPPRPVRLPEREPASVANIRDAFTQGGPLVSCWNVNGGWNLNQQVEWIKSGHHYAPTIFAPTLAQRADKAKTWDEWYALYGESLAWINAQRLPVTVRFHNFGADHYNVQPRRPFTESALVWTREADGTLNDEKLLDPLAPVKPWADEGEAIVKSYFVQRLAEALPDVPRVFILENNEAPLAELGAYTTPTNQRDEWRYRKRAWRPNLEAISVRMAEWAQSHNADECEAAVKAGFVAQRQAMVAAIKQHAPAPWRGKVYVGGYGGLGSLTEAGLLGQTFSHKRPQENWAAFPFAPEAHEFDELSERCYDDGSGSPWNWHDWARGPHVLQHNLAPLNRYLESTRPLWHDDRSFLISPTRSRKAAEDHGGYVLPDRAKGFARACLWSDKPERSALVLRWFANSQEQLTGRWFDGANDPPELAHLTHGDYFAQAMAAVDEVWREPELLRFWRHGEPVLSPDPALCDWELPPDVIDDRSRVLTTDADPPRFDADGNDTWRAADGKLELRVFAQAYRIGNSFMVYAWSPRMTRENVTVQVPGFGPFTIPTVGPEGGFHFAGVEIPDPDPPAETPQERAVKLLREARELLLEVERLVEASQQFETEQ